MFKELTEEDKVAYREWARIHYEPLTEIKGIWHPVVQAECVKINEDHGGNVWDHKPYVTKMVSPMTGEIRYLCSLGNPFDNRSKLVRYFSMADNLSAMEWQNEYGAVLLDVTDHEVARGRYQRATSEVVAQADSLMEDDYDVR